MKNNIFYDNREEIFASAAEKLEDITLDEIEECRNIMSHVIMNVIGEMIGAQLSSSNLSIKNPKMIHGILIAYALTSTTEADDVSSQIKWMKDNLDNFIQLSTRLVHKNDGLLDQVEYMASNDWGEITKIVNQKAGKDNEDDKNVIAAVMMVGLSFAEQLELIKLGRSIYKPLIDWLEQSSPDMNV